MNTEIQWCCAGQRALHENLGKRGFSGLVSTDLGIVRFLIQFRAVDADKKVDLSANRDIPISLAGEIGQRFCPWCGVDLEHHYRDYLQLFPRAQTQ
jgi:hypothetical protein